MSALPRQAFVRVALIAAGIGLAGAHAPAFATPDLPIVVATCPKEGRDPSAALMKSSCGVSSPDDFAAVSTWGVLEVMALDGHVLGGGVVARLQCMSRASGALSVVAMVRSGPSPTTPKKFAARLPAPLDFRRCAYLVRIDVDTSSADAQALMVVLRN